MRSTITYRYGMGAMAAFLSGSREEDFDVLIPLMVQAGWFTNDNPANILPSEEQMSKILEKIFGQRLIRTRYAKIAISTSVIKAAVDSAMQGASLDSRRFVIVTLAYFLKKVGYRLSLDSVVTSLVTEKKFVVSTEELAPLMSTTLMSRSLKSAVNETVQYWGGISGQEFNVTEMARAINKMYHSWQRSCVLENNAVAEMDETIDFLSALIRDERGTMRLSMISPAEIDFALAFSNIRYWAIKNANNRRKTFDQQSILNFFKRLHDFDVEVRKNATHVLNIENIDFVRDIMDFKVFEAVNDPIKKSYRLSLKLGVDNNVYYPVAQLHSMGDGDFMVDNHDEASTSMRSIADGMFTPFSISAIEEHAFSIFGTNNSQMLTTTHFDREQTWFLVTMIADSLSGVNLSSRNGKLFFKTQVVREFHTHLRDSISLKSGSIKYLIDPVDVILVAAPENNAKGFIPYSQTIQRVVTPQVYVAEPHTMLRVMPSVSVTLMNTRSDELFDFTIEPRMMLNTPQLFAACSYINAFADKRDAIVGTHLVAYRDFLQNSGIQRSVTYSFIDMLLTTINPIVQRIYDVMDTDEITRYGSDDYCLNVRLYNLLSVWAGMAAIIMPMSKVAIEQIILDTNKNPEFVTTALQYIRNNKNI